MKGGHKDIIEALLSPLPLLCQAQSLSSHTRWQERVKETNAAEKAASRSNSRCRHCVRGEDEKTQGEALQSGLQKATREEQTFE